MGYPGLGEPAFRQLVHHRPCRAVLLAAPAQGASPEVDNIVSERRKSAHVRGHGVVGEVASQHRPEPCALFSHALVPSPSKSFADFQQPRPFPVTSRVPGKLEAALSRARTDMGKAKEVERLRLAVPSRRPVGRGPAAEFDQASLLGVQFQGEFRHTDA